MHKLAIESDDVFEAGVGGQPYGGGRQSVLFPDDRGSKKPPSTGGENQAGRPRRGEALARSFFTQQFPSEKVNSSDEIPPFVPAVGLQYFTDDDCQKPSADASVSHFLIFSSLKLALT